MIERNLRTGLAAAGVVPVGAPPAMEDALAAATRARASASAAVVPFRELGRSTNAAKRDISEVEYCTAPVAGRVTVVVAVTYMPSGVSLDVRLKDTVKSPVPLLETTTVARPRNSAAW